LANLTQGTIRLSVYYAENIAAGDDTVTFSGAATMRVAIFEYSGFSSSGIALDQVAGTTGQSSSPASPTVTTTSSPELVFGAMQSANATPIAAGAGYTLEQCRDICSSTGYFGTEDEILPGSESVAATWNVSGHVISWSSIVATFRAGPVVLPQSWVCSYELDDPNFCSTGIHSPITTDYTITYPSSGSGGSWTCVSTRYEPYTANTQTGSASLQQALTDMENCRTINNKSVTLVLPKGSLFRGSGLVIPQTSSALATKPLIVMSSGDSSLPNGQIICTHGFRDNVSESLVDVGLDNPDCKGDAMSYTLAGVTTPIPSGAFTLVNGSNENTANYNDVQYMATIEGASTVSPLTNCSPTASGSTKCLGSIAPDHWLFEDLEIRMQVGDTNRVNIVNLNTSNSESYASQMPHNVHLRKIWTHGDWAETVAGLSAGSNSFATAYNFSVFYGSIEDSYLSEVVSPAEESHAVWLQMGRQIKVDHNYFSGASTGYFSGGFSGCATWPSTCLNIISDSGLPGQNVEVRRNHFGWPYAWIGQSTTSASNPNWPSISLVRKNMGEIKQGQYWVVDGNIFENTDNSGGQRGPMTAFSPRQASGGNYGTNYNDIVADVTFSHNLERNSCQGPQASGRSNTSTGDGGGVSFGTQRTWLHDNLFYNIYEENPGCPGDTPSSAVTADYGGNQFTGTATRDTTGTIATFTADPEQSGLGQTDFNIGDHVLIAGCTVADPVCPSNPNGSCFNNPTYSFNGKQVPQLGMQAISPTAPTGLTVVVPSVGTANASDSTCTLINVQGWPNDWWFTHNTVITGNADGVSGGASTSTLGGPNYASNSVVIDNIITAPWRGDNGPGEGNPTETFLWDLTSLSAFSNVFSALSPSAYTEVGNNSYFPDPNGCTGTGCTPTRSFYFPVSISCTGSTVTGPSGSPLTGGCVGFTGMMNTSSFPLTFSDWHSFALLSDSPYAAGQTYAPPDGKDMGSGFNCH
jgi:hypothetical protein